MEVKKQVYLHNVSRECRDLLDKADHLVEVTIIEDLDWHIATDELS